jgi:serine/threonine-protein kinase
VLADVSAALEHLAMNGLVHRDVSPPNVLIGADGHAVLADFGFVRAIGQGADTLRRDTSMSYGLGRWAYGAPELFDGRDVHYDHRVDIYSLGAVAIALLTGHPPRRWPPRRYRPEIPPAVADLLWAMVDDGPAGRPSWPEITAVFESLP